MPIEPTETDVETTEAPAAPSLREALDQAFETTSEGPAPVADQVGEDAAEETAEQAAQRARDEAGRFAKEKKAAPVKAAPAKVPVKPTVTVKPVPGAKPVPTSAQQPAPVEMKPPQSFRGPAKEAWAQVPEAVRVEVLRREKEIATQLTGVAEERKYASAMREAFRPFEAQIRAEGSTPEAAIGKLMNTAMALRTAPPAHKAQLVAAMIQDYGVPLEHLVTALSGRQAPSGQAPQQQYQAPLDPAAIVEQVSTRLMQQLGTQRDTALLSKAEADITSFLDAPGRPMHGLDGVDYSDDIRQEMADLIEAKAKRGSTITLERAYYLAAREHPEVSKVLEKQERAAAATKAQASTERARAAASSVRHQPATQPVTKGDARNLREALEASFDAASER